MTNNEMIIAALKSDYLSELSVYEKLPNRKISRSFDRRMKKMLRSSTVNAENTARSRRIKTRIAVAVIIAATAALATGGTILLKYWDTFSLRENSKYSVIKITDTESSAQFITEHYAPEFDKTDYITEICSDNEFSYSFTCSGKNGKEFYYSQCIRDMMDNAHLGTENAQVAPEKLTLGDISALYYVTSQGSSTLIWDNGKYMFNIMANGFSKNELIQLALSVQITD